MKSDYCFRLTIVTMALIFCVPCQSADIGRLFLSPTDRLALDDARRQRDLPTVVEPIDVIPDVVELDPGPIEDETSKPQIHVDGFVKRHGTSGTVWINGVSTYDGDLAPLNVDHQRTKIVGSRVQVAPLDAAASVILKPGQGFDPNNHEVAASYKLEDPTKFSDSTE